MPFNHSISKDLFVNQFIVPVMQSFQLSAFSVESTQFTTHIHFALRNIYFFIIVVYLSRLETVENVVRVSKIVINIYRVEHQHWLSSCRYNQWMALVNGAHHERNCTGNKIQNDKYTLTKQTHIIIYLFVHSNGQ